MTGIPGLNLATMTIAAIAGALAGAYLAAFHPGATGRELLRRSVLQGWYFASTASIFYVGRIVYGAVTGDGAADRVLVSWLLWITFCVGIATGAYIGGRVRLRLAGVRSAPTIGTSEENHA